MLTVPARPARQTWSRIAAKAARVAGLAGALAAAGCAPGPTALQRAALLASRGREGDAVALLREEVRRHPRALAERRLLVRLHAATGDLGAAEREAAALAELLPEGSPVPLIELGHAMELSHRYDEALALYDRAAEVAPRDPAGPRAGGMRAARWGEPRLSIPRLEEALRRDPRDAEVWHALGHSRLAVGDLAGARVAYESGLVAGPTALENRLGLATVALAAHDAAGALAEYDRVLAERPGFADGHLGRAYALAMLGRTAEARGALAEARRLGGDPRAAARQEAALRARAASSVSSRNP